MRKNERQVGGGGEQGGGSSVLRAVGVVFPWCVVTHLEPPVCCRVHGSQARYEQPGPAQHHDAVGLCVSLLPARPAKPCGIHAAWPKQLFSLLFLPVPLQEKLGPPHAPGSAPSQVLQMPSKAAWLQRVTGKAPSVLKKAPFQHLKYSFLTNKMFIF